MAKKAVKRSENSSAYKEFQESIKSLAIGKAEDLYVSINESELSEGEKQALNIELQCKMAALEQSEIDAGKKKLEDVKLELPTDGEEPKGELILPPGIKAVVYKNDSEITEYEKMGKLYGFDHKKKLAYIVASLLLMVGLFVAPAYAGSNKATLGGESNGTYDCAVNSSGELVCQNDVTFRSSLLAIGRAGAASTVASSSTNLAPANLPYLIVLKNVGGGGGIDSMGYGTVLQNGTPGQVLAFLITGLESGGSWVVTPTTKTGFTKITFDTKGDTATLLYVSDTVGWVVIANGGAVISQA